MKKFLAILLAMMLVLVNVAALADDAKIVDDKNPVAQVTPTTPIVITKSYEINGTDSTLPAHTITFRQTSKKVGDAKINGETISPSTTEVTDEEVPDVTITLNANNFTDGQTTFKDNLTINLPSYTKAGVYDYTFVEVDGGVAGVEYFTDELKLSVTIVETATTAGAPSSLKIGGVALRRGSDTTKIDDIKNVYSANTLTVSKTVTGNLGDYTKDWNFTVTLTAPTGDTVYSTITTDKAVIEVVESEEEEEEEEEPVGITTIAPGATGWTGTRTFTFKLKHGESLTFKNLPVGVTYTVAETEADTDGYTTTGTVATATAIAKDAPATAAVTNDKDITVDTGIALETLPFVLLMGIALVGVMALRRREEY